VDLTTTTTDNGKVKVKGKRAATGERKPRSPSKPTAKRVLALARTAAHRIAWGSTTPADLRVIRDWCAMITREIAEEAQEREQGLAALRA